MQARHHASCKEAAGFTLIELLVVISIISLLISILLPALSKARESARIITCGSQMRQQGYAFEMYMGDYAGRVPNAYAGSAASPSYSSLIYVGNTGQFSTYASLTTSMRLLSRYLGATGTNDLVPAAHCPGDTIPYNAYANFHTATGTSYMYNIRDTVRGLVYGPDKVATIDKRSGILFSEINVPSRFVTGGDYGGTIVAVFGTGIFASEPQVRLWHDPDKYNLLFGDGHVGYFQVGNLQQTTANWTFIRN